jgi:TonB family protein
VFACFILLLLFFAGADQGVCPPSESEDGIFELGPDITLPKVIHKEEPVYTWEAREAGIQGACILEIVIDENGLPARVTVLSPLGFGLDEKAVKAISAWRFTPARKNGMPGKVHTLIDVNFRLQGEYFNNKVERQRTAFNLFLSWWREHPNELASSRQVALIQRLAKEKFAPAYYVLAVWQISGRNLEKNENEGIGWLKQAVDRNYGPALFYWGRLQMTGTLMPKDEAAGIQMIRAAALLGSPEAQMMLGRFYEKGEVVEKDRARSRNYFRLCAASDVAECQYHLGRLLLSDPERSEHMFLQGLAWLQLSSDHGFLAATTMAEPETAQLNEGQKQWVARLKKRLLHQAG